MRTLHDEFGEHFADIFKTIMVNNGSEFADFAQVEQWGTKVFFAHPYSSWKRGQNERHNGLFRAFVPKGQSIEPYTAENLLAAADELNGRSRKKLGYRTLEELFEAFLDSVYAA
jgi:IS30 family transposase